MEPYSAKHGGRLPEPLQPIYSNTIKFERLENDDMPQGLHLRD